MEVMTVGMWYIALALMHELMETLEKGIMAAGVITLLLSIAYGIYDRIRSEIRMQNQEYINGLIGELEQELMELEEEHCSSCSNNMNIALCEGCDVSSHKSDLEQQIYAMREQ